MTLKSAVNKSNAQSRPDLLLLTTTQQATKPGVNRPSSMVSISSRCAAATEGSLKLVKVLFEILSVCR